MPSRQRLPNRRFHKSMTFRHGGVDYTCGMGFFHNGELAEVFLNASKIDSDQDINARDGAVLLSIALQYGAKPATIKKSMSRNMDGSASGPLGYILDLVVGDGND